MSGEMERTRAGFTLVETLVVITIIGILAALTLTGVFSAINSTKQANIALEIQQMERAIADLATKTGGTYPPDFSFMPIQRETPPNFQEYINKFVPRFARSASAGCPIPNSIGPLRGEVRDILADHWFGADAQSGLDQAEALVFWLGGYSKPWLDKVAGSKLAGTKKLLGFRAPSQDPFVRACELQSNPGAFNSTSGWISASTFEFDDSRLADKDEDGWYEYYPPGSDVPYVYFEAHSYAIPLTSEGAARNARRPLPSYQLDVSGIKSGYAAPYLMVGEDGELEGFVNPTSYQIISAGLDSEYSDPFVSQPPEQAKFFNTGNHYTKADEDNITNFSEGQTLGDAIP